MTIPDPRIRDAESIARAVLSPAVTEGIERLAAAARASAPKTVGDMIRETNRRGMDVSFTPYEDAQKILVRIEERSPAGRFAEEFFDMAAAGDVVLVGALQWLLRKMP